MKIVSRYKEFYYSLKNYKNTDKEIMKTILFEQDNKIRNFLYKHLYKNKIPALHAFSLSELLFYFDNIEKILLITSKENLNQYVLHIHDIAHIQVKKLMTLPYSFSDQLFKLEEIHTIDLSADTADLTSHEKIKIENLKKILAAVQNEHHQKKDTSESVAEKKLPYPTLSTKSFTYIEDFSKCLKGNMKKILAVLLDNPQGINGHQINNRIFNNDKTKERQILYTSIHRLKEKLKNFRHGNYTIIYFDKKYYLISLK